MHHSGACGQVFEFIEPTLELSNLDCFSDLEVAVVMADSAEMCSCHLLFFESGEKLDLDHLLDGQVQKAKHKARANFSAWFQKSCSLVG
jgi:hypothetical protein